MSMSKQSFTPAVFAAIALAVGGPWIVVGCADTTLSAADKDARDKYLLAKPPSGALPVLDVRKQEFAAPDKEFDVVLTGKIGSVPNPWPELEENFPWGRDRQVVFIVDPTTAAAFADSQHTHAGDDCVFCARRKQGLPLSIAAVKLGASPIDLKKAFDLREGDTVVVRGKAKLLGDAETSLIDVTADGIYIAPRS